MATVGRSIGYSLVLTLALAALAFLVDRSADPIIDEFEKVIVPCQHGGEWVSAKETCRCLGPWTGKYCGECACENGGVCDTNNIQVATPGTLWGCRCPDRLVGPLCEQCNANLTESGQCAGPCKDGYTGPDCNRFCSEAPTFEDVVLDAGGEYDRELEMLNYGGELHVCSGHGNCDGATGYCECKPFYFSSEDSRSSCARTCPFVNNKLCAGHGQCSENAGVVSCACEFGYHLAPACDVACPGMDISYIQEPCSGRGTCFLESASTAACECGELFIGEACQYRCPTGAVIESSEACSGHGVCRKDDSEGFTKAVCDCESPFQGPGCGCTRSLTCTGHGNCRADGTCECDVDPLFGKPVFRGERCEKCIPGHYGSDCRLQCTSHEPTNPDFDFEEGRSIHCHGRGTCAVANFGLADESVVCGACSGNFATESHCEECKDNYYPKFSVMDPDDVASCTTFATRTTCNGAGEPKDTFGRKTDVEEAPCDCDAPHADALAFCSKCELSYYPSNLKEDPEGACSRRCVDKELEDQGIDVSVAHIETLQCVNDGVCADDGLSCICADGYSGVDCGIACGAPDEHGQQCSGHGQCVANTLQQFLEFEINVRGFTASRCECSPQDDLTEAERLKIFTGELLDQTGEATTGRNKRDWYGDTCGFGCLAAPWKDGTECNNERCEVIPIADDAGNPILQCTQDSQCGTYNDGMLKFYEGGAEKTVLTGDESRLRGAVSLSRRWSKRTGPFCHVTNTPFSVWEPNMKCAQRINKDGEDPTKEAECHKYTTRYDCLHKGEGACHYIDVCTEALDEFDTWSYCYELMRTHEPPALHTKVCAESCNSTLLKSVEWGKKCAHYRDRVPDGLCAANEMQNLDSLCDLAEDAGVSSTTLVSDCNPALPPAGVAFTVTMDAADASAFCWEVSDQVGAIRYPFNFTVLLDTPEARHLQAAFHLLFTELGSRDTCVANSEVNPDSCANVPEPDDAQANVLYLCSDDGVQVLESTDKSGLGVSCEPLPTVQDVSPFEMVCPERAGAAAAEGLSEIGLEEAVFLSARRGCALRAKSALHASSVAVDRSTAMSVCKRVLDAESPSVCEQTCGPDDQCSDLGTTHNGKRLLQCRRPDASDVGIDPDTGKCDNCLVGDCSITGREGGAEYRCVVSAAEIVESATPPRFEPCSDTLLLHLDELGGGQATVGSVQGQREVKLHDTNETVRIYEDQDHLDAAEAASGTVARPPPALVEFDVHLNLDGRGRVAVLGRNGTLVSLLLHYYGGFGYDVNAPLEEDVACNAGEEDNCKFVVAPGATYRVVMTLDWETELVSVKFADQPEVVRNITIEADDFAGVAVSGAARVSQLWVFSSASATCANLHRKLGRSLTMQASRKPATEQPPLSMTFCAGVEKAIAEHVKGCAHEREAVFEMPWHDYCAYVDHLKTRTSTGDCGDWQGEQALTIACEPVLSKFATPDCAKNATSFDWETEYCVPLRNDTKPDELVAANCSAECIAKVAEDDFAQLCDDRDKYWDADDETARADFLPSDCNDNGKWKELDWVEYCTEKAENSAKGYCSAAVCDCRGQGGWMTGDACELDCPMADDYSPCAEDSLGGYCTYRRRDAAAADAFYEDPDKNLIKNHPVMQIQGKCACSHPDALAEEGCKVECDSPDGGPACNTRTYTSNGTEWQLSACDAGGSGVCRCMSPLARRVNTTVSNWRGQSMNVLTVEFGGYEGTNTTAFPGMSAFRLHAHQGAKELMMRYFGVAEAAWETMKLKFESSPADFDCDGRECDFHDVVIAQSLYSSSSFFGGSCSRRCPGVDTGEDMEKMTSGCDIAESTLSGKDRVSEEGCQSECLDDFRCAYFKWETATSDCSMFSSCVSQPDAVVPEGTQWRQRVQRRPPNLTPCSGRGQCGLTGQCQCDPAKELSLTNPITGEKNLIPSNKRHGLSSTPITTLDLTGYRGDACEKVCPGYNETKKSMADVCSGHGICTRAGACQCDVNYVGVNCELRCPVKDISVKDDQTVCSGHGTCSEARVFAGYDATEEDSKRYYMVTEAYRKWHNECQDNTAIDYFILPFEGFSGSVASSEIKGGVACESVPQEQDDPTVPFLNRPEIKLEGLSDYVFLDDEDALTDDGFLGVLGVSGIAHSGRQGVFRRRFWQEGDELKQQTVFVENYTRVSAQSVVDGANDEVQYDRFYGYRCGAPLQSSLQPVSSVPTVADCAVICESVSGCECFQYREFYHRRFQGECVLGGEGALVDYPVVKVAYVHTTNGFLQKLDESSSSWHDAPLAPFDVFENSYVQLHQNDNSPTSCRAPTSVLGTNVASLETCAVLCASESASGAYCTFFSYDPYSLRCSQVRTVSAECIEGMTPNSAGFYAVSTANTGSISPTAYTRAGSARIFPRSTPTRGRLTGTYVGRARPGFETAIASCDCLSNAAWGYWDGHRCQTCQKFYGSKTCSRRCPGVTAAKEPCFGYGKCLWGSKDGEGEEFFQSRCLCGNPAAPYVDDLASVGVWEVEEFDLHVETTFNGLPPSEAYEDPRNYNFASSTCSGCREGFGGMNCASTCSYCLFSGSCSFAPSTVSISVPCNCIGTNYDPYNSCCPNGFMMLETLVHNDVRLLTTSLRRKRLSAQPDSNVAVGKFYESAVFPSLGSSLSPSRRWCTPGPGMYETEWMKPRGTALASACGDEGTLRNRGMRKLVIGAAPPRYFPQLCSDLGADADGETYWKPKEKTLWYAYPNKVFVLNAQSDDASYVIPSGGIDMGDLADNSVETFAQTCRDACESVDMCNGAVVRTEEEDSTSGLFACFSSQHNFIRSLSASTKASMGEHKYTFTAYRKQRQPDLCVSVEDSSDVCVLGSIAYGEIPLCATKEISDSNGGTGTTTLNLLNRCEIRTNGEWQQATGAACDASVSSARADENTDVLNRLVPSANALLFGAYGNSPFQASAAEVRARIGEMRPENPCATLPGDYFWNKDNRSQCISASTSQSCSIKDWRHCTNFAMGENMTNFLHSKTIDEGTYPHNLNVDDLDLEITVEKLNLSYYVPPIDTSAFQNALDTHEKAANASETEKENEINALNTRITFRRAAETDTYAAAHVYESSGGAVDMDIFKSGGHQYSFIEGLMKWEPTSLWTPAGTLYTNIFDPFTWPQGQVHGCPFESTADHCQPMGLEEFLEVSEAIEDYFVDTRYWTEKQFITLNIDDVSEFDDEAFLSVGRWWDSSNTNQILYASKLEYMCMRDFCNANDFDEQWTEDASTGKEFRLDTCYIDSYSWHISTKLTDKFGNYQHYYDRDVCPPGCYLRDPDDDDACVWCGTSQYSGDARCFVNDDNPVHNYHSKIYRMNDACKNTCTSTKLDEMLVGFIQSENFGSSLQNGAYAKIAYENLLAAKNKLQNTRDEKATKESELVNLKNAHASTTNQLTLALNNALSAGMEASCTTDVPCDMCAGHCESDDECLSGLMCGLTQRYCPSCDTVHDIDKFCSGQTLNEHRYCIRATSNNDDTVSELYQAGSVTAANTATTWLMIVGGSSTPTLPVRYIPPYGEMPLEYNYFEILKNENMGIPECVFACQSDNDCAPGLLCAEYTANEPLGACETGEDIQFYYKSYFLREDLREGYEETRKEEGHTKLCYNPVADRAKKVMSVFAQTDHTFDDTTVFDSLSAARASSRFTPSSTESVVIEGTISADGSAGNMHPHGHAPWLNAVAPRSLMTITAEECVHLCDATYGCTAAHWEDERCNLFHFDPALGCSLFKTADSATADNAGFVRYPDACRLCKSRGLRPHINTSWTDNSALEGAFCDQSDFYDARPESCIEVVETTTNDFSAEFFKLLKTDLRLAVCKPGPCALFPLLTDDEKSYTWEFDEYTEPWRQPRCPPTRAGIESNMLTRTVMVGKTFQANPTAVLRAHPEITSFPECENACVETPKCRAWSFEEAYEAGEAVHLCELYETVPTPLPTASASVDTFLAAARVGFVERDFSPKIAFFDDGAHPACDCFEGSTAYNCACIAESFEPFQSKPTNEVYGCAGHGECSSLEYKCICDEGYGWMWGGNVAKLSSAYYDHMVTNVRVGTVASTKQGFTCRMCPAGTFKDKTVLACTRCSRGMYQDVRGQSSCKTCPFGYQTQQEGALRVTECLIDVNQRCSAGRYIDAQSIIACAECPSGFFSSVEDASGCQECAAGFYTAEALSTFCNACPGGWYAQIKASLECAACAAGKIGNYQNGCADCAAGKFSNTDGALVCATCPNGWFAQNAASSTCTACPAGKTFNGQNGCEDCAAGTFSPGVGSTTSCTNCPIGWYAQNAASSACTACAGGKIDDGQNGCQDCAAGKFSNTAAHYCTACPAGYMAPHSSSATCTECPEGKSSSKGGATTCVFCHDATLCKQTYFTYFKYVAYEVIDDALFDWSTSTSCGVGGRGRMQGHEGLISDIARYNTGFNWKHNETIGMTKLCTNCYVGEYYTSSDKITTCKMCPAGYRGSILLTGATDSCADCTPGYYQSEDGQYTCAECGEGKYQALQGQASCEECAAGQFTLTNQMKDACTDCPAGRYQDQKSQSECIECPGGYFSSETGAISASVCFELAGQCEVGKFLSNVCEGDDCCQFCPPGKTTPRVGTFVESECQVCPSGWSSRGAKSVTYHNLGWTSGGALNTCRQCQAGYAASIKYNLDGAFENENANSDYGHMCQKCTGREYTTEPGRAQCDFCPDGWAASDNGINDRGCSECVEGKYSFYPLQRKTCTGFCWKCSSSNVCPVNQFYYFVEAFSEENGCYNCPAGYSQDHPRGTDCLYGTCPAGKYVQYGCTEQDGDCCEFCPAGQSTPGAGTYREDQCQHCPAGWSSPGDATLFGRGAYTTNACTKCPIGFAASSQYNRDGAHENDINTNGIVVCRECNVHEYSTEQGQEQCKTCPDGYRARSPSLNTLGCEECPTGTFSLYPNPGFTCEDALCDAGNYYDEDQCKACPAGFYQNHRRATGCLDCPDGYEAAQGSSECALTTP